VSLALAMTASAAPVPKHLMKEPVLYHPVEPGAKWVYQFHGADDPIGREVVEVVVAVHHPKGEPGVKVAELGSVFEGKTRGSGCYVGVSRTGLVEGYMSASGNFVGHTPSLRIGDAPGTRWETAYDENNKQKHIFRGEEDVEVPAGKFRALRVETAYYYKGAAGQVWNRWYAPGIGMVKLVDAQGGTKVLKEFTAGSK
jgi:hypothetical protein